MGFRGSADGLAAARKVPIYLPTVKGFPNQVADLVKVRTAISAFVKIYDEGSNPKDDGVFGEALVRAGVAGTGHVPKPIEEYLRGQRLKPNSGQSFRTTARGLRELFRLLGFIDDLSGPLVIYKNARTAAEFHGDELSEAEIHFWRRVISNLTHDGDGTTSHPYQVLLKLVARCPGITRAKCALALDAKDDTPEELERIVELASLTEEEIRKRIGVTEANWENAKKVLPKFAEQLGDVVRRGQTFVIADAPGRAADTVAIPTASPSKRPRAPRTSRVVSPETVARAGTANQEFDEHTTNLDPAAAAAAIKKRFDRLRRHNEIVRHLAARINRLTTELYEDPFDLLAIADDVAFIFEVKTLDGTPEDEVDRVRDALSQLLYYETFVVVPKVGDATVRRIAVFEGPIKDEHKTWLNQFSIGVVCSESGLYRVDELSRRFLGVSLD